MERFLSNISYFYSLPSILEKAELYLGRSENQKGKKELQNPESGTEPVLYRGEKQNSLGNVHIGYPIFRYTYSVTYWLRDV